jgi:hypothetical protein
MVTDSSSLGTIPDSPPSECPSASSPRSCFHEDVGLGADTIAEEAEDTPALPVEALEDVTEPVLPVETPEEGATPVFPAEAPKDVGVDAIITLDDVEPVLEEPMPTVVEEPAAVEEPNAGNASPGAPAPRTDKPRLMEHFLVVSLPEEEIVPILAARRIKHPGFAAPEATAAPEAAPPK